MTRKIGFTLTTPTTPSEEPTYTKTPEPKAPRKSVVQVFFAERNRRLTYYNDQFDLHPGDVVYVSGMLEGLRGRVTEVNYNFKIRVADYHRVIAVADTKVKGKFHMAGSHFVTFDPVTLPIDKVRTWFMAPAKEEEEYASGNDDAEFSLDNLRGMNVSTTIADRGQDYYTENRVRYVCVDGNKGYAIVTGTHPYEVEFEYDNGVIRNLVCSCFCSYTCKHEVATMLQLRETLNLIAEHYEEEYADTGYFAAIYKGTFFENVIGGMEKGSFVM